MMGQDFDNPFGLTLKNGSNQKMSHLLNMAVFPGNQGGPLEHVIAAKAIAFQEALEPEFKTYAKQTKLNAKVLEQELSSLELLVCLGFFTYLERVRTFSSY